MKDAAVAWTLFMLCSSMVAGQTPVPWLFGLIGIGWFLYWVCLVSIGLYTATVRAIERGER